MILIVCADDNGGVMFNHRRQSRDRVLRSRVLQMTEGKKLWMSEYSARQFGPELAPQITVCNELLEQAGPGEYCFLEGQPAAGAADRVESVILFKWNRVYPTDVTFDLWPLEEPWQLTEVSEFEGSSHEKITMEVYVK